MSASLQPAYREGVTGKGARAETARALDEVADRWEAAHPPELLDVDHGHDGRCRRRHAAIAAWRRRRGRS